MNGLGRTDCEAEGVPIPDCPKGLGNLIVGYPARVCGTAPPLGILATAASGPHCLWRP